MRTAPYTFQTPHLLKSSLGISLCVHFIIGAWMMIIFSQTSPRTRITYHEVQLLSTSSPISKATHASRKAPNLTPKTFFKQKPEKLLDHSADVNLESGENTSGEIVSDQTASSLGTEESLGPSSLLLSEILKKVDASLRYPLSLRRRKIHGRVEVKVVLNQEGRLNSAEIIKTSGFPELDRLALSAISDAAPYPMKGVKG